MRLPSAQQARPNLNVPSRFHLVLLLSVASAAVAATSAHSQSTLPPTAPTALTAAPAITSPISATSATSAPTRRPQVTFTNGLLNVRANDASLHQILRLISRRTGMKVSGSVEDLRIFGDYGPAEPSSVLATLLGGTGVNLLIREDDLHAPVELVLTPRTGGISPPSFNAMANDPQADDDPQNQTQNQQPAAQAVPPPASQPTLQQQSAAPPSQPVSPQGFYNVLGSPSSTTPTASQIPTTNSVPLDSLSTPTTAQAPPTGIVDSPSPTPSAAAQTDTPPATPTTPEQIYQQLLKMQQQSKQSAPK